MNRRPSLQDVQAVPVAERVRVVRKLCRATSDVDERLAIVAAAFIPAPGVPRSVRLKCCTHATSGPAGAGRPTTPEKRDKVPCPAFEEDECGQLVLPLDSPAAEFRQWLEAQPQPSYIGGGR